MAKESKNKEKKIKPSKGKSSFAKDTKAELKKVIWPNPKQLFNNTFAVITIVVIIGVIVFLLDVCFEKINSYGIDQLKEAVQSEEIVTESDENVEEIADNSEVEAVEETTEEQSVTETESQGE